jgi:hypothetical protein
MRSTLRLADLETAEPADTKLMNAQVPDSVDEAIERVAADLGCSKTAVVVALLNEGLAVFSERRGEFPAPKTRRPRRGRPRAQ